MLTAKGSDADRIAGLEAGADDYLPKPFNPKELLARIKAVLRRQTRELPGAPSQQMEVVEFGSWTLDLSTRTLKRDGNIVTLTTGEFSVLKALVQHPREPLTRDKLMNLARGREWARWSAQLMCKYRVYAVLSKITFASALYPNRLGRRLRVCTRWRRS